MTLRKVKSIFAPLAHPLFAIVLALLAGSVAILLVGESPIEVYRTMFRGAFGSTFFLLATLNRATPIIITGLGAAIAWKAGYRGIGGEGQMIIGGFVCAIVALHVPGPPIVRIILAVLAAVLAGGLWSVLTAWLLDKFKVTLAISSLMLNFVAAYVTMHFITNQFQDRTGMDIRIIHTEQLAEYMRLPRFVPHHSIHYGFIIAIALVFLTWFIMNRTNFGYEARMTGYNLNFCNYGGVSSKKTMYMILALSGIISALAGVGEVFGVQYRYVHDSFVSASFAWVGLTAALISRFHPIGVLISSIILAGINTGGSAVARSMNMPIEISSIVQGCVILFISAQIVIQWRRRKKVEAQKPEDPAPPVAEAVEGGEAS